MLIELKKSTFYIRKIKYFGYIITPGKIRMDLKKIAIIKNWKMLTNIKEVQAFLGLANYYRKFILRFKHIALPLTNLTKKGQQF